MFRMAGEKERECERERESEVVSGSLLTFDHEYITSSPRGRLPELVACALAVGREGMMRQFFGFAMPLFDHSSSGECSPLSYERWSNRCCCLRSFSCQWERIDVRVRYSGGEGVGERMDVEDETATAVQRVFSTASRLNAHKSRCCLDHHFGSCHVTASISVEDR
jgi:hypothetical protein